MRNFLCLLLILFAGGVTRAAGEIIASWNFSEGHDCGGSHPVKLRGKSVFTRSGLLLTGTDRKHGQGAVTLKNDPALTPGQAFQLEVRFVLSEEEEIRSGGVMVLVDNKYIQRPGDRAAARFHSGYQLALRVWGNNLFSPVISLGYGSKSNVFYGSRKSLVPGKAYSLVMNLKGDGTVNFLLDGRPAGEGNVPSGGLAPAGYPLYFGDRVGSGYMPFIGMIQQVVIRRLPRLSLVLTSDNLQRSVFERGEEKSLYGVLVRNVGPSPCSGGIFRAEMAGRRIYEQKLELFRPGEQCRVQFMIDSRLLPGSYPLEMELLNGEGKRISRLVQDIAIVPAYGDFMPVILWNNWDPKDAAELGFTHLQSYVIPWRGRYSEAQLPGLIKDLDESLKMGLYRYSCTDFRDWVKRFPRLNREGKPYPRKGIDASNPQFRKEAAALLRKVAECRGSHPAWDGALLNTEERDGTNISFGGTEPEAFRAFAGFPIPENVSGRYPVIDFQNTDYSWDRIVRYNAPEQVFYRWFWKDGDGWNTLHTLFSKTLHQGVNHHFFTWFDPAVRVPPIWGSGGRADVISQWSYSYPDPIKLGQATDEVLAMAQGRPGQRVMSMTQAIWYRRIVAPREVGVDKAPEWLTRYPDAQFVTIAPDCLRIAFWSKIARRIDGIMYHGSGALLGVLGTGRYRFTNSRSREVLKELIDGVVRPLGPVLKKIPERVPEVGILESFTASLYAPHHFPFGWSDHWAADLHLALQWGGFQPAVFYEEHFLENRVEPLPRVLFIPGAEVLSDRMLAKLQELQRAGVILVGDEFTSPALMVDLRIHSVRRNSGDPEGSRGALQKLGRELAAQLKNDYVLPVAVSNQNLVVRRRGTDMADYLFVINDKRTFGTYVGQWRRVMEKGLPNSGTIEVKHVSRKAYDLVEHREIPLQTGKDGCAFQVLMKPAEGKLILLLKQEIARPEITVSDMQRGRPFMIRVRILDPADRPVQAILPVKVTLQNQDGKSLPGSGYFALQNGELTIPEVAAPNMKAGRVIARVQCLASGRTASCAAMVR